MAALWLQDCPEVELVLSRSLPPGLLSNLLPSPRGIQVPNEPSPASGSNAGGRIGVDQHSGDGDQGEGGLEVLGRWEELFDRLGEDHSGVDIRCEPTGGACYKEDVFTSLFDGFSCCVVNQTQL